ncbi:MAG: HEAT repeat domain-containing protein [Kiritimatiellae bacterium]|nr:HEAT repeat domain-containing protein [Kiritimatiellia bacterium]
MTSYKYSNLLLITLLGLQLIYVTNVYALRIRYSFWQAWTKANIVVIGTVNRNEIIKNQKHDIGIYNIIDPIIVKGEESDSEIFVADFHYRSTAGLSIRSGSAYILFLLENNNEIDSRRKKYLYRGRTTYSSIRESIVNNVTQVQIYEAVKETDYYSSLTNREKKINFLMSNLETLNPHLRGLIDGEIMALRVKEAVPYYEKKLNVASESESLNAAGILHYLGYSSLDNVLIKWLQDPNYTNKIYVIDAVFQYKYIHLIPELRKLLHDSNPLVVVNAAGALYGFEQPDGKSVLLKYASEDLSNEKRFSKRSTAKSSAGWYLKFRGHTRFSEKEKELLKKYSNEPITASNQLQPNIVDDAIKQKRLIRVREFQKAWSVEGKKRLQCPIPICQAKYQDGDWNRNLHALSNFAIAISNLTQGKVRLVCDTVDIGTDELFTKKPHMIYFTGSTNFTFRRSEIHNLRVFGELERVVWIDRATPGRNTPFDIAVRREFKIVFPDKDFKIFTTNSFRDAHRVYFTDVGLCPGVNGSKEPIEIITKNDELIVIYTCAMWEMFSNIDSQSNLNGAGNDSRTQEAITNSIKFVFNIINSIFTKWSRGKYFPR